MLPKIYKRQHFQIENNNQQDKEIKSTTPCSVMNYLLNNIYRFCSQELYQDVFKRYTKIWLKVLKLRRRSHMNIVVSNGSEIG